MTPTVKCSSSPVFILKRVFPFDDLLGKAVSQPAVFGVAARVQISFGVGDHREIAAAADLLEDLLGQHLCGFGDGGFEVTDSELTHGIGAETEDGAVGCQHEGMSGASSRGFDLIFWLGKRRGREIRFSY